MLRHLIVIDDGSGTDCAASARCRTSDALAGESPERDFGRASDDDIYILYTGGTTGLPEGRVWRQEDVFRVLGGGIDFETGESIADEYQMSPRRQGGRADGRASCSRR